MMEKEDEKSKAPERSDKANPELSTPKMQRVSTSDSSGVVDAVENKEKEIPTVAAQVTDTLDEANKDAVLVKVTKEAGSWVMDTEDTALALVFGLPMLGAAAGLGFLIGGIPVLGLAPIAIGGYAAWVLLENVVGPAVTGAAALIAGAPGRILAAFKGDKVRSKVSVEEFKPVQDLFESASPDDRQKIGDALAAWLKKKNELRWKRSAFREDLPVEVGRRMAAILKQSGYKPADYFLGWVPEQKESS